MVGEVVGGWVAVLVGVLAEGRLVWVGVLAVVVLLAWLLGGVLGLRLVWISGAIRRVVWLLLR